MCARQVDNPEERDWPYWADTEAVRHIGNLVDPAHLDRFRRLLCGIARSVFRDILRRHSAADYADRFENLCLIFIEGPHANAVALQQQTHRAIAITLPLLRRLWGVFQIALTDAEFLRGQFDSPPPAGSEHLGSIDIDDPRLQSDPREAWPGDRYAALLDLFCRGIEFLICHEMAHHARDHLPYLKAKLGLEAIEEAFGLVRSTPKAETYHVLEFDADHHGLDLLVVGLGVERPFSDWDTDDAETQCFQWAIAILIVFLTFDVDQAPIDQQYGQGHPAPVHRAMRLIHALTRTFADIFAWSDERRIDWHDTAWVSVSDLAHRLQIPPGRWHGDSTVGMDEARFIEEEQKLLAFAAVFDLEP